MKIRKNWKKILLFAVILIGCFLFLYQTGSQYQGDTEINQAYITKEGADGRYYIIDQGHKRLICLSDMKQILYQVNNPRDRERQELYIDDFCVDEEGVLYVQASVWSGMHLSGEEILQYKNGKLKSVIKNRDYSSEWVNKHQIMGICLDKGKLQYIVLSENKVRLYSWNSKTGEELLWSKDYKDAENRISDCVIKEGKIWILDKNGTISRINAHKNEKVFDVQKSEFADGIPYKFVLNKENEIYYTDIRKRMVLRTEAGQNHVDVVVQDTDSVTVSIFENSDEQKIFLSEAAEIVITDENRKTEQTISTLKNSCIRQAGWWFAVLYIAGVGITSVVLLILYCFKAFFHALSTVQRIGLLVAVMLLFVAMVVSGLLIRQFNKSYMEKISEQIEAAAYMIAVQLGNVDISSIQTASDYDGDEYRKLTKTMENAFPQNIEFYQQIYCNILTMDKNDNAYAVAYLDQSVGDYYPLDELETDEVKEVYRTGEIVWNAGKEDVSGSYLYVKVPISDQKNKIIGVAAVGTEMTIMRQLIGKITKNILSVLAILILLFCLLFEEVIFFLDARNKNSQASRAGEVTFPQHWMRLIIFGVFAAYNMTASFLPVYIIRYCQNLRSVDQKLAGSLPVTLNILVIGAASLLCQAFIRKLGIKKLAILSGISSLTGNMLIFLLPSYGVIVAGLILDGIGVGFMTNAVYILISRILDAKCRMEGLTVYNGAYLAGLNFGVMLGSLLAVQFGQRIVFLVVAGVWIFLSAVIFTKGEGLERGLEESEEATKTDFRSIRKFILNRTVDSFIVFMQNPYIVFGSFVFYFVPLFCENAGYTELVSTLLLLLYAEIPVFLGEWATDKMMKKMGYRSMYVAYGGNVLAVLIFALYPHMPGMIVALVLMGLSACFGKTVQQMYFLELKEVRRFGTDKAMGVYNFVENIGESLGPIIFGGLMFRTPLLGSVIFFSSAVALLGCIHYLVSGKSYT